MIDEKVKGQEAQDLLQKIRNEHIPLGGWKPGVYTHYKSSVYIAYSISIDEFQLHPLVHYYSMEKKTRWTRPLKDFQEVVTTIHNERYPRFRFMRNATPRELCEAAGFDDIVEQLINLTKVFAFVSTFRT